MPGLMALRGSMALRNHWPARESRAAYMTIQTAVLIETLTALGAEVRWSSCNVFSTQDQCRRRHRGDRRAGFAWKEETEEEFWWCIDKTIEGPDGWVPNMILDDGGTSRRYARENAEL